MNMEQIKNNDPGQLKQMIIYLKAELTKYEQKVKEYENSFHYSIVENLEQENAKLTKEKNELAKKLRDTKRVKYTTTADKMRETRTDWLPVNKQLHEMVKKINDNVNTEKNRYLNHELQIASLEKEFADYKSTIEQIETRLVEFIQKSANRVHTQIEDLTIMKEERLHFEETRQRLLKEIEGKNNLIEKLQQEIIDVKEQKKVHNATIKCEDDIASELLLQVEHQIKEVLAKSVEYEEDLDAKLAIIHALEHNLDQLTAEIDGINVDDGADDKVN